MTEIKTSYEYKNHYTDIDDPWFGGPSSEVSSGSAALHICEACRSDPVRRPVRPDTQHPINNGRMNGLRVAKDGNPSGISVKKPDLLS